MGRIGTVAALIGNAAWRAREWGILRGMVWRMSGRRLELLQHQSNRNTQRWNDSDKDVLMVRKCLLNVLNLWTWNEKRVRQRERERSLVSFLEVPFSAGGQTNLNKPVGCERCSLGSHLSMCLFYSAAPSAVPTLPVSDSSPHSVAEQSTGVCFTDF